MSGECLPFELGYLSGLLIGILLNRQCGLEEAEEEEEHP